MLGRHILPVMHEIAHLPGGHKPLHFVHKLADGTSRHVQTYALCSLVSRPTAT